MKLRVEKESLLFSYEVYITILIIGTLIVIPVIGMFVSMSERTIKTFDDTIWMMAAIVSLFCSIIGLKDRLKGSWSDRTLYLVFLIVWISLFFVPLFREGGIEWQ